MNLREHHFGGPETRAGFRLKPLARSVQRALLPGLLAGLAPALAVAAPSGGQVKAGIAAINQNANKSVTTITQQSQRAALDWQSFNVGKNQLVQFKQPNTQASALNRIFDQNPSQIFGQVKANGQVVLMNPNGVFFKPGAKVNVGSLVAGAMQIGVAEFMQGSYRLQALKDSAGRVINEGTIEAADGGDVTLVGQSVANHGVIVATAGRVNLVAGEQVTVDFDGDGLLRFAVDKAVLENAQALDDQISNSGDIIADGGDVLITASAADGVFRNAINNSGLVKAGRIENRGGRIMLTGMGPGASVLNTGQVNAAAASAVDDGGAVSLSGANVTNTGVLRADAVAGSGGSVTLESTGTTTLGENGVIDVSSAGGAGGQARVLGEHIALTHNAQIDASGDRAGGEVLVGGDYQGKNDAVRNAETTFVSGAATINADAGGNGDGGKVIVWADDSTHFYGDISARGGERSGDGGFAEVSGKENLTYRGHADLTAPAGARGTLLLDPATLTIIDADAGGEEDPDLPTINTGTDQAGGANTVSWGQIAAQGASADIQLQASGQVTVNDVSGGGTTGVTDVVAGEIHLSLNTGSITIESTTGDVDFTTTNTLVTEGGSVSILAGGTATVGNIRTSGAADTLSGGTGTITITSATGGSIGSLITDGATATVTVNAGTMTQTAAIADSAGAAITALDKQGAGTLQLSQANTYTGNTDITAGTLQLSAGGSIADSSAVSVSPGATFDLNDISDAVASITGGGDIDLGSATLSLAGNGSTTYNGVVSGTGNLTKNGTGNLNLGGNSTLTGTVTVGSTGFLLADVADVFVGATLNVLAGGARFNMQGNDQTIVGLSGGGELRNGVGGNDPATLTINGGGGQTFTGIFSEGANDTLSITKTGAGAQTLNNAGTSSHDGAISITDGTLSIVSEESFGTNAAGTTVSGTGTLDLANLLLSNDETISIEGSGIAGIGALTATGTSSIAATNAVTLTAAATIGGAGTLDIIGSVAGSTTLTKAGAGALTLSGDNSGFTGAIAVNSGKLVAAHADALGDTGAATTVANNAALEFAISGSTTVSEVLTIEGDGGGTGALVHSDGSTLTLDGGITVTDVGGDDDFTVSVTDGSGVLDITSVAMSDGGANLQLIKTGSGTLELSIANAMGGATVVSGGTVLADAADVIASSSGLTLSGGSTFNLNGNNQSIASLAGAATDTVTNDTTADNSVTLTIADGGGATFNGILTQGTSDTLSLTKSGSGTQTLSVATGDYGGAVLVTGGTLRVTNNESLGEVVGATTTSVSGGGTLQINFALNSNEVLELSGAGDGGIGALSGDGAASVAVANTVTLTGDATVGATGGNTLVFNTAVGETGARNLTKGDAGTVELGVTAGYTGSTTVNDGTLRLGVADAITTTVVMDQASGQAAVLDLNDFDVTLATLSDGVTTGGSASVTNSAGASLLTVTGTSSYSGTLDDGGGTLALTKSTGTTLELGGTNTYTGATNISGGTLQFAAGGSIAASSDVTVAGGATLNLNGTDQSVVQLNGAGTVTNSETTGASTNTLSITGDTGVFTGTLTDGTAQATGGTNDLLALTKSGTGTQTLTVGTGDYGGALSVTGGTLVVTTNTGFGNATGATSVSGGGVLEFGAALTVADAIAIAGVNAGTGALEQSFAGLTTLNGVLSLTADATVDVVGGGTLSVTNAITGTDTLTKIGTGTLLLNDTNNLAGGGFTLDGGTLAIGQDDVLATDINLTVGAGTTFNLNGNDQTVAQLNGTGKVTNFEVVDTGANPGLLTITGGGGTFSGTLTDGVAEGLGGSDDVLSLTKSGTGTQTLSAATGNYGGTVSVTGGTLRVTTDESLGEVAGATTTSVSGGTLQINFALNSNEVLELSGTGDGGVGALSGDGTASVAVANTVTLTDNATVGATGGSTLTINTAIGETGGARNLTKGDAGTVVLGVANSYTGNTTVNDGTLRLGNAGSISSAVVMDQESGKAAVLDLNDFDVTLATLSDGVTTGGTASVTNSAGASLLTVTGTSSYSGTLDDGGGTLALTKSTAGTLTLGGAGSTYSGATNITGGVLSVTRPQALGDGSAGTTVNGGTLELNIDSGSDGAVTENLTIQGTAPVALIGTNAAGTTVTGTVALAATTTIQVDAGDSLTLGGVVSGGSDLTKSGAGTLVLANTNNSHSGTTTVAAGTLAAGAATVFDATTDMIVTGTLNLNGFDQDVLQLNGVGTVTNSHVGISTNTLDITGGGGTFSGQLTDGTAQATGGSDDLLALTNSGGTQTLTGATSNYGGATMVTGGVLSITRPQALGNGTGATTVNGGTLQLDLDSGTVGAVTENLTIQGTAPVALIATNATGTTISGTVTLAGASDIQVDPGDLLTISGAIGGGNDLTKSGTGTLTLGGGNGYTGTTNVSGGTLQFAAGGSIAASSDVTVAGGATLNLNGTDQSVVQLNGAGTVTNSETTGASTNTLSITGDTGVFTGTLTDGTAQATGGTNDLLALTKSGTGTQTLTVGTGDYGGALSVTGGTLVVTTNTGFGNATGATSVSGGGVLEFGAALTVADAIAIAGVNAGTGALEQSFAGLTTLNGVLSLTADATVDVVGGGTLSVTNAITGTDTLTKIGTGTLLLNDTNNLAGGGFTLDGGTLAIGQDDVLATDINLTVGAGTTFNLNGNDQTVAQLNGTGKVTNFEVVDTGANPGLLTITGGGGTFSGTLTDGVAEGLGGSDDVLSLTKSGTGTQTLSAATGNYGGTVSVTGGTLRVTTDESLGEVAGATTTSVSGGTLQINFALNSNEVLELSGTGDGGVGALSGDGTASVAVANTVTLTDNATVGATGGSTLTINTAIGETGGARNLTKGDAGTVVLGVANSYTGNTTVNDGTLRLGNAGSISSAVVMDQESGKAAVLDLNDFDVTLATLSDGVTTGGTASVTNSVGASLLTVTGTSSYSGTLDDGGGTLALTKSTAGTLTLGGGNTYTGATTISGGTLALGASNVIDDVSDVVITGGTFDLADNDDAVNSLSGGSGTLDLGLGSLTASDDIDLTGMTVTIAAAGNANQLIDAGTDGTGTLTAVAMTKTSTGNLTLGGATALDLNGTIDVNGGDIILLDNFTLAGSLTASGNVTLTGLSGTIDGAGNQIIDAEGGTLMTGGLSQSGAADGNLTLGGNSSITATGLIAVLTAMDDLIIADAITTNNDLTANRDVIFQGSGAHTFTGGAAQSVTATTGAISDAAGTVLTKTLGTDLFLTAAGDIGASGNTNRIGVEITGAGRGLHASSTSGSVYITSAADLQVERLQTGAGMDVEITTTASADLTMDGTGGYVSLATDDLTLTVDGDLVFETTPMSVNSITASFGQDGSGHSVTFDTTVNVAATLVVTGGSGADTFNLNAAITDGTGSTFNGGAGDDLFDFANGLQVDTVNGNADSGAGDVFDLFHYTGAITFTASALNDGTTSGALTTAYNGVERVISGSSTMDKLSAGTVNAVTFTISGADQGTAPLLFDGTGPTWQGIENLEGSTGNDSFVLTTGSLSGGVDGLNNGGAGDTLSGSLSYTLTGTGQGGATNLDTGSNTLYADAWVNIENLVGTGPGTLTGGEQYTVTGMDSGTTPGGTNRITGTWSMLANLTGSAGNDIFAINDGGSLSGTINDGTGANDTLTYAARTSAVTVTLNDGVTTAVVSSVTGGVSGIETFIGSSVGGDTLNGRNEVSTWTIDGGMVEQVADVTTTTMFAGFEILQGGSAVDTFDISTTVASFSQFRGGDTAGDTFNITGNSTVTADFFGEGGDDTLNFGTPVMIPPGAAGADTSNIVGDVDLGAGTGDTLDFTGSSFFTLVTKTGQDGNGDSGSIEGLGFNADLIGPAPGNGYAGVNLIKGNGLGTLQGDNVVTFWNITGVNSGEFASTLADLDGGPVTTFTNFSVRGGTAADTFIFQTGGHLTSPVAGVDGGTGARNILVGSSGADTFSMTGSNSLNLTVAGLTTIVINMQDLDGTVTQGVIIDDMGNDVFNLNGNLWGGFIKGGGGSDTINTFGTVTATINSITANGMNSAANNITANGGFTSIEVLNTGAGNDTVTLTVAPVSAVNTINLGTDTGEGTLDSLKSTVAATWVIPGPTTGSGFLRDVPGAAVNQVTFSGVENLSSTQASVLTLPSTAVTAASIGGTFTAPTIALTNQNNFTGTAGLRINGDVTRAASPLLLDADVGGNIAISGDLTVGGALTSTVGTGTATYLNVATGNAAQTYNGNTVIQGDLTGGNLRFNSTSSLAGNLTGGDLLFNGDVTINNDVTMTSSTGVFDFVGDVSSTTEPVLNIVPPANTDIFVDNVRGPGHIRHDAFQNFTGSLVIGGEFAEAPGGGMLIDGTLVSATADYIQITEDFLTGGNLLLVGSAIEFAPDTGDIEIAAGPVGGGEFALFALGNSVQAGNDGITNGIGLGSIAAPANQQVTFTGGDATLAATAQIINSTNMIMNLGGGSVLVAQSDAATNQQVDFNVRSNAVESSTSVTDTALATSVAQLAGFANPASLFQNAQVFFPNPAAVLTILQAVSFVDASLFEEDLSLFGVIGNGVALSLDQCEDAEGCAPSVTEEELAGLINTLLDRISRLEGLLQAGEIDADDGQRLLAGYRDQLQNFLDYQQQLAEYIARQEADEFGDDFGDEFDDVFEAEESFDDDTGGFVDDSPAEQAPVFEEPAAESFEELEEVAEDLEEPAADEQFEDLEEAVETFDAAPFEPDPLDEPELDLDVAPDEFEEFDEFEELEEELDDSLFNDILLPNRFDQLAGTVRVGVNGEVQWTGDVILPTLHRRY